MLPAVFYPLTNIRNFCIIAHIDHGKTTLSNCLLQYLKQIKPQTKLVLDELKVEQQRGITVKLNAVQLFAEQNNQPYLLNLIDTPGHVDFAYEVSRAVAACEGAILLVDATQGIEAQTLSHAYIAIEHNLHIIPVINKIDLETANVEQVVEQLKNYFAFKDDEFILISAKQQINIDQIIPALITRVPVPTIINHLTTAPLAALVFDSYYDQHLGVMVFVRIFSGQLHSQADILFMQANVRTKAYNLGFKTPQFIPQTVLYQGYVGWIETRIKDLSQVQIGDTITTTNNPCQTPLPGYKKIKPMVYCAFFPVNNDDYPRLKTAIAKLALNDSSFVYEAENSDALGFGYRCGFLGSLHAEIIQQRLFDEYQLDLIVTLPNVAYLVEFKNNTTQHITNPAKMPDFSLIVNISEPTVKVTLLVKQQFLGKVIETCVHHRGQFVEKNYLSSDVWNLVFVLPLNEVVVGFFDEIKACSKGYASLDYEWHGYQVSDIVKMSVLINNVEVDSLTFMVHRNQAFRLAQKITQKLKILIPRQQFEVPIQAVVKHKVIARETVKALRKNVLSKCYGGDISRKRKLLEKQKEGKEKMKKIGKIYLPQTIFANVLKLDE